MWAGGPPSAPNPPPVSIGGPLGGQAPAVRPGGRSGSVPCCVWFAAPGPLPALWQRPTLTPRAPRPPPASQAQPQTRPPSLPAAPAPAPGGTHAPSPTPQPAAPHTEVLARPTSMEDVQQLLNDLTQRQEQLQQARLPGLLAEPSTSKTASPAAGGDETAATTAAKPESPPGGTATSAQPLAAAMAAADAADALQRSASAPAMPVAAGTDAHGAAPSFVSAPDAPPTTTTWMSQPVTGGTLPRAPPLHTSPPSGGAAGRPPAVSVPLLSSSIAAMLAGSLPLTNGQPMHYQNHHPQQAAQQAGGGGDGGVPVEAMARLQQQLVAQAQEQQRQLSYVQSMHQWAGRVAGSLRQLQQHSRKAVAAAAAAAKEEAATAQASLMQLASLHDSSQQQVCQLSLEVAELKEQMHMVLMEGGGSGGGAKRRRAAAAVVAGAQRASPQAPRQPQPKREPAPQPPSPKRAKGPPLRVATAEELAAAGMGPAAAAAAAAQAAAAQRHMLMLGGPVSAAHLQLPHPPPLHLHTNL